MGASVAASKFESRPRLEFMYAFFVVNIKSSLIRLYGFQLPVLLP